MHKRVISFLCALALLLGMVPWGTYAEAVEATATPVITVEKSWITVGQEVEVDVSIANNPGIIGGIFTISWAEGLELVSAKNMDAFEELNYQKPSNFNPSGTNFMWYGDSVSEALDGVFLTLTFTVLDETVIDRLLAINVTARDVLDSGKNAVSVQCISGGLQVIDYMPGDVTDDGVIDMFDITDLAQYISDNCTTDPNGFNVSVNDNAANVDDNGVIDMLDLILICQYVSDDCETRVNGFNVTLLPVTPKCAHVMETIAYKAATCTEAGNPSYCYCTQCEKYFNDEAGSCELTRDQTVIPATGHTYSEEWSVDQSYHWHSATCEHTDVVKDKEAHSFGSDRICGVCGASNAIDPTKPYTITYKLIEYNKQRGDTYLQTLTIVNENPASFSSNEAVELVDPDCGQAYIFNGWFTEDGRQITRIPVGTTEDIILYARWTMKTFEVTYHCEMSDIKNVEDFRTYTPDKGIERIPTPERVDKYTFVGWSDKNGNLWTEIPVGTTKDLTLYANWASHRNQAVAVDKLKDPVIIEEPEKGRIYFAYELGQINNVPLYTTLQLHCANGLITTVSVEKTKSIGEDHAKTVAQAISTATTNSASWTMDQNWTDTTSLSESQLKTLEISREDAQKQSTSKTGTFNIGTSFGGSKSKVDTNGSSYQLTNNQAHSITEGTETGQNFNLKVDGKYSVETERSAGLEIPVLEIGAKAGVKTNLEIGVGAEYGTSVKNTNSATDSWSNTEELGFETSNSKTNEKNWNTEMGFSLSQNMTTESSVTNTLTQALATEKEYAKSYTQGGSNSQSQGTESTDTKNNEFSASVTYFTSEIETKTTSFTSTGETLGNYRMVMAGTVYVYAIVGYDVATKTYFVTTHSYLDPTTKEYLDYSRDGSFTDYESSILPFEIPSFVNDYVNNRIAETDGLTLNMDSGIYTAYSVPQGADSTAIISVPSYHSYDKDDGTATSVKVTGLQEKIFQNHTEIKAVILGHHIKEIPAYAFDGCTSLEYVICTGITKIGDYAFRGCENLKKFVISSDIEYVGIDAFEGAPEIMATPANVSIAKAILTSGTQKVTLDTSAMEISKNDTLEFVADNMSHFELRGKDKTYTNLSLESKAETTVLNGVNITDGKGASLDLYSGKVTLNRVSVNTSGYGMFLRAPTTDIALGGMVRMTAGSGIGLLCRNLNLSPIDTTVDSKLVVNGKVYICGTLTGEEYLECDGIEYLTEGEYANMLKSHYVFFNANGGTVSVANKLVAWSTEVGELPVPTRTGYTFGGWFTKDGKEITASSIMEEIQDITVYAKWTVNAYKATWSTRTGYAIAVNRTSSPNAGAATGTLKSGDEVYYGDVLAISYSANTGYTLKSNGETSITVTADVTETDIYASAEANSYTYNIVYKSSNGTALGTATATYKFGTTNTITPPAKSGYNTPAAQTIVWDSTTAKTITFSYTPATVASTKSSGQIYNDNGSIMTYSATVEHRNRTATNVQIRVTWTITLNSGYNNNAIHCKATVGSVTTGGVKVVSQGAWGPGSGTGKKTATVSSGWINVSLNTTNATSVSLSAYCYQANANGTDLSSGGYGKYSGKWTIALPAY